MASRKTLGIGTLVGTLAALALAGFAVWIASAFGREIAGQRARIAQGSRLVDTRCGVVEVAEAGVESGKNGNNGNNGKSGRSGEDGPASGLPLLVVHGSGGGFDQGLALAADLAPRGWRVIAPSRFGYLRTPWPEDAGGVTGERQADQLACLLDALGIDEVAVMGVSAGAISATEFAVRHARRTKALILMVPAGYQPHGPEAAAPMPGWAQALLETVISSDLPFWLMSRIAPDVVRRFVLATPPSEYAAAPEAEKRRVDRVMREILPISARRRGLLHDTAATQRVPRPRLETIGVPTLAISARDDGFGTLASAVHAAQTIPGARLLVFDRGGHLLLNHQAEVVAAVEALLREAAAGSSRLSPPGPAPAPPSTAKPR